MWSGMVFLMLLGTCIGVGHAISFPSYLKACSRNDPNLNQCALKSGREAIKYIVKGDRKYKIPNMDPLLVEKIELQNKESKSQPVGLQIVMENLKIHGIADAVLNDIKIDVKERTTTIDLFIPRLEIPHDYQISGRILLLPIKGHGASNITVVGANLMYSMAWDLEEKSDGKLHMASKDPKLDMKMQRLYVRMENLFDGNKLLGDNMNQVLNENWEDLVKDLGPIVSDAFIEVMAQIINGLIEQVPYDEIYPDTP